MAEIFYIYLIGAVVAVVTQIGSLKLMGVKCSKDVEILSCCLLAVFSWVAVIIIYLESKEYQYILNKKLAEAADKIKGID
jgi:hypothetical protein